MAYKWCLDIKDTGQRTFNKLPTSKDRMAVFDALQELLEAEDPYFVPGVKKLLEAQFEGMRRQEVGNFRIMFWLDSDECVRDEHTYKGTLHLFAVVRRNEKTYR
jgi:mRNA-degrading endonuclease RelE of RelBE toxin-antitoxin system